ncbi:hypothetical protein RRF57_011781 [Xylaria bambusicola]|uniref:Uncharacterized protein n=1 Tax=Xylaria bambusicola TaxID=326684 RepID=A0AAN7UX72_9PEZI
MDGSVKQRHSGLFQKDGAQRNIMLVPSPQGTTSPKSSPRVVLIDYNIAVVTSLLEKPSSHGGSQLARNPVDASKLPSNPVDAFWVQSVHNFPGWGLAAWFEGARGDRRFQEWLLQRFGSDTNRFAPIRERSYSAEIRVARVYIL